MIDLNWLKQMVCFSGANLGERNVEHLAKELGEVHEVLPYLVTTANAFADWPLTRDALRDAARSLTGATQMRPGSDLAVVSPAARQNLRASLEAILIESQSRRTGAPTAGRAEPSGVESDGQPVETTQQALPLERILGQVRVALVSGNSSFNDDPSIFISGS